MMESITAELLAAKAEPYDSARRCRPISARSALEPVDEEPHVQENSNVRTTVDRAVGSTPLPSDDRSSYLAFERKHLPPFISSPIDAAAYQQSLAYYHAVHAHAAAQQLYPHSGGQPINARTNEGRYFFTPPGFHQTPHQGYYGGSPTQSDISLLSMPSLANSIPAEHYQRQVQQTMSLYGLTDPSRRNLLTDIPGTPGSGSITLPPSVNSSRLTSPRPSVISGKGRKRALSHSPLSEFLDIQSLTRSSEDSLLLTPLVHHSRSSSAATGSYGHLSAASFAAAAASISPAALKGISPYIQAASAGLHSTLPMGFPPMQSHYLQHASKVHAAMHQQQQQHIKEECHTHKRRTSPDEQEHGVVSSTVPGIGEEIIVNGTVKSETEEQNEFKEKHCSWKDCDKDFELHKELVKHINQDHIATNRKAFICQWKDCCREGKPFKAQYMLVVHMRRHTGEKPHRCVGFPGCTKAYSRLENLKTHRRSHTGEKPYMCEYPGCQKAFSNASDRAKHQNRTHSNEKPYACGVYGCDKKYTDPSSLRKHVKTIHGEEYTRKKHKGMDTPTCKISTNNNEKEHKSDDRSKMMEECLTVTGIGAADKKEIISSNEQQNSPQSDTNVQINIMNNNVINSAQSSGLNGNPSILIEEEPEDTLDNEGNGDGLIIKRAARTLRDRSNKLKGRMASKTTASSLPSLPTIPNILGTHRSKASAHILEPSNQKSGQTLAIPLAKHKRLGDLSESGPPSIPTSRRDSNTSTLSSYMSSVRSDASLAAFNSRFSSRRSSEVSQNSNRLSIINSPYEYDMTGNLPNYLNQREVNSMTDLLEKAKLGSQPNLCIQSQAVQWQSSALRGDNFRHENDGWRTTTPAHTPLPNEYPQYGRRRASDPVRCVDPNFNELKKLQKKSHSLSHVQPLPIPANMKSLRGRQASTETFQSSRSSVATNPLGNGFDAPDFEANLQMKMIEDNEDVLIPDDMRQFLQQQKAFEPQGQTTPRADKHVDQWVQETTRIQPSNRVYNGNAQQQPVSTLPVHIRQPMPANLQNSLQTTGYPQLPAYPHSLPTQCHNNQHNFYTNTNNMNSQCCAGASQSCQCHQSHSHPHYACQGHCHIQSCNQMCSGAQPCTHQCLMPPPSHSQSNSGYIQVSSVTQSNRCSAPGNYSHPLHYPTGSTLSYQGSYPQQQQQIVTINPPAYPTLVRACPTGNSSTEHHQLSPPCEVSSSTDKNVKHLNEDLNLDENILDNISSISADTLHPTIHLISSVSKAEEPGATSNLVINDMNSVLSQYEASRYQTSMHE